MHCPFFFFFHKLYFLPDIQTVKKENLSCKKVFRELCLEHGAKRRTPKGRVCTLEGQSSYFPFQGSPASRTSSSFCLLSQWQVIGNTYFSPTYENKKTLIGSQFYLYAASRLWPVWKLLKINLFLWQSWRCSEFPRANKPSYISKPW